MSVWVGGHGVRYSNEFRNLIYEINPGYLPCVYKEMFENNATNVLRDCQETPDDINKSLVQRKKSANVKSGIKSTGQIARCYSAVPYEQYEHSKQDDINGWKVCSTAHSTICVHCNTSKGEDLNRHRCHSASAKLNTIKNETISTVQTSKFGKARQPKDRTCMTKLNIDGFNTNQDFNGKSNDQPKTFTTTAMTHFSTAGYVSRPTSPIQYKFAHFEYSENYIEQYRQEYTMRKLDEFTMKKNNPCVCGKIPSTHIPSAPIISLSHIPAAHIPVTPIIPLFYTPEHVTQDIKLRVTNSIHTDTQVIRAKHEAAKKKQTKPYGTKMSEHHRQQQSQEYDRKPPQLFVACSSILNMEYYTNPLIIDNRQSQRCKSPIVCRSRLSLPNPPKSNTHPSSATTPNRIFHKKL